MFACFLFKDPDAPVRQNRPIADLDIVSLFLYLLLVLFRTLHSYNSTFCLLQEDEKRLLKHLFAYIRAGKLQQVYKSTNHDYFV